MLALYLPQLTDFVLYGLDKLDIDKDATIFSGAVGSNRSVTINKDSALRGLYGGEDLKVDKTTGITGDIVFNGTIDLSQEILVSGHVHGGKDIKIDQYTTIQGDVVSAGKTVLAKGVTVHGSVIQFGAPQAFTAIPLPPVTSFSTNPMRDINLGQGKTTTLAPGAYGDLKLSKSNVLNLSTGKYYFDKIEGDQDTIVNLNVSAGEIAIFVKGPIKLGKSLDVNLIGGGAEKVYLETHQDVQLQQDSEWFGTIYAPYNKIDFDQNLRFIGAVFSGREIDVDKGSQFNAAPAQRWAALVDKVPPIVLAALASDTGRSPSDRVTYDARIAGTVSDVGTGVGTLTATVDGRSPVNVAFPSGNFTFNPGFASDGRDNGLHEIVLTATDRVGNTKSVALTLTLDVTPPPAPSALRLTPQTDTGPSNSDGITRNNSPVVTGGAESNSLVRLFIDNSNSSVGSALANGSWQVATGVLAQGQHTATATAEDVAGNISPRSAALAITIDVTDPVVLAALASDTGRSPSDRVTRDARMAGTVSDAGAGVATLTASVDGRSPVNVALSGNTFTFDPGFASDGRDNGPHEIVLTATDRAGNTKSVALTLTLDVTPPPAPSALWLTPETNTGHSAYDGVTQNVSPVVAGDAEANSLVRLLINGNSVGQALANSPWEIATGVLAQGRYAATASAEDVAGNVSPNSTPLAITIDVTRPAVTVATPLDGATLDAQTLIAGQAMDDLSGVHRLYAQIDDGPVFDLVFDTHGMFSFGSGLPADGSADGPHTITVLATDLAGNDSLSVVRSFTLQTGVPLREQSNFTVIHQQPVVAPDGPSTLEVRYANLLFDTSADFINDAFEMALVDSRGRSLVHTIAGSRDSFFNFTESEEPVVSVNARHSQGLVEVDLAHIPPGTQATLVVRLVNNDADTTTSVSITGVDVVAGSLGTPVGTSLAAAAALEDELAGIDFTTLADVTASMQFQYGRTSFNDAREVLLADFALANAGTFAVAMPLLVVIDSISAPTVAMRDFDGRTPNGKPFLRMASGVTGSRLNPGDVTDERTLALLNPNGVQFSYELLVLAQLNRAPAFTSQPAGEALVAIPYRYQVGASDPDGDPLAFSLVTAPPGMSIDSATGRIDWTPAASDVGTHSITVHANDDAGTPIEQSFTLIVRQDVPNRPPIFTSEPVVDAEVAGAFEVIDVRVGENPVGVAVGDFSMGRSPNSLVTVNLGDQSVSVGTGTGNNRFAPRVDLGIGEPPPELARAFIEGIAVDVGFPVPGENSNAVTGVARGDFNRDGFLDLAAALDPQGTGPGFLAIVLGNGDGTFQAPRLFPLPAIPGNTTGEGVLARDFDADGFVDVVMAFPPGGQVLFYKGDGHGSLAPSVASATGGSPTRVQTADLNHDGKLDLVAINSAENTVAVLLGNGNGTFAAPATYPLTNTTSDLVLSDLDGLNGVDLVVSGRGATQLGPGRLEVRLNNGTGQFGGSLSTEVPHWASAIHVADFDQDARLDVVSGTTIGEIVFHQGQGNGTFAAAMEVGRGRVNVGLYHENSEKFPIDLNGDGRSDVAFGNRSGDNIMLVGLGRGDGTFDIQEYLASPGWARNVPNPQGSIFAVVLPADFNGDGVIDLAVGAQEGGGGSGGLSILLGETPGSFLSPAVYPKHYFGEDYALADYNNDGITDLAQTHYEVFTRGVDIRLGRGDGKFGPALSAFVGFETLGLSTPADFDQDGNVDLAGWGEQSDANPVSRYFFAFGLGTGAFTPHSRLTPRIGGTADNVTYFATEDFNGDSYPDFVTRTRRFVGTGELEIWLFDPAARSFTLVPDAGQRLFLGRVPDGDAVAVADFDGDFIPDLLAQAGAVASEGVPERLWFFKGKHPATVGDVVDLFDAPTIVDHGVGNLLRLAAADFNLDGHMDFAGVGPLGNSALVSVFLGNGHGTFQFAGAYAAADSQIVAADITGDGIIDLVTGRQGLSFPRYGLAALVGRGDGTFLEPKYHAAIQPNVVSIAAADLDGDGSADLVASEPDASVAYLSAKPGLQAVATGDINGDGKQDILAANAANGRLKLFLGDGDNNFSRQHDVLVGRGPVSLAVGDLNCDGQLDAVTANQYDDSISLLINSGGGTFARTDLAAGDKPVAIALGDLTGDSEPDIVVANAAGQSITLYVNQGDGTVAAGIHFPLGDVPHGLAIADATGDGINDVVVTNPNSDRVTILPGLSGGMLGTAVFVAAGDEPTGLAIADLNQDGKPEIIISNPGRDAIGVLYSRGGGRFTRPQEIGVGRQPGALNVADVDRDGLTDIVVANMEGRSASVVYNRFDPAKLYVYQATATDPDSDPLTFSLLDGPGGMLLDAVSGRILWAPGSDQVGPNAVTLEVSDGRGGAATQSFVINVTGRGDNHAPIITGEPATSVGVTQTYDEAVRGVDYDSDQVHYSLAAGPDGMAIDDLDGRLQWNPRSHGLEFDGNDYVSVPDDSSLRVQDFTLEAWVRFDGSGNQQLLRKGSSFSLALTSGGDSLTTSGGSTGAAFGVSTPFDPIEGKWYHLAATFHDTTNAVALFVDGVRLAMVTDAATIAYDSSPLTMGLQFGTVPDFVGAMDEVRVWSRARNETEIRADMWRGLAGTETGLVAYYQFDESDFLAVRDTSSAAHHGTLGDGRNTDLAPERVSGVALAGSHPVIVRVEDRQGGITEHSFTLDVVPMAGGEIRGTALNADVSDGALKFDGTNDFVDVPDSPSLHSDRALTVSGWFKADNLDRTTQDIFFKGDAPDTSPFSNREYSLRLHDDGHLSFNSTPVSRIGVGQLTMSTAAFIEPGRWYHFAAVIDSDAAFMRLFIDGNLEAEGAYDSSGIRDTTGLLRLGRNTASSTFFAGSIDELRIYHVARTQAQIQADMLDSLVGNEPGLAAAWNFNESSGTTAFDLTTNENDGILGGDGAGADLPMRVISDAPSSDQVLRDWVIYVDGDQNGLRDPGETSATTDTLGQYSIANLLPGTYPLAIEVRQSWLPVTPPDGRTSAVVLGGETTVVDFSHTQQGVTADERGPMIVSVAPTMAEAHQLLHYAAVIENPDGRPVEFDLPVAPLGMAVDPATGVLVWRPAPEQVGEHRVLLRVRDDRGLVDIQDVTMVVAPGNSAPIVTSTPRETAVVDRAYRYRVLAQDAEQTMLEFVLALSPLGMSIDSTTGRIDWTPAAGQLGTHAVDVVVGDGRSSQTTQSYALLVMADAPNHDPLIDSTPRTEVRLGNRYLYHVLATDADPDPLSYELLTAPAGMTIDAAGRVSWDPEPEQLGPNAVRVRVRDGLGGEAIQEFSVEVKSQLANLPPEIVSDPLTAAAVDRLFAYDLDAFDPDGDPLDFLLEDGPEGMSLDAERGTLRWLPDASQVGAHDVAIRVFDPAGGEDEQHFTVRARGAEANSPPLIRSTPPTETAVGSSYLYPVDATDAEGDLMSFSLLAAPPGMSIDGLSGDIVWTPFAAQVGTHPLIIRVADARGASATQAFEVVVLDGAANRPPVITSSPLRDASVGDVYAYDVEATDPEGLMLRLELLRGPAAMSIDEATGLVEWTPSAADVGLVLVTIAAFDAAGAAAVQSFELLVQPANNPPAIQSTPPASVAGGAIYRYDVLATDPDFEPLSYSLLIAPAGMMIDNFGRLRWTTSAADLGPHDVEIQVGDRRGATDMQAFQIVVQADALPPLVSVVPHRTLVDAGQELYVRASATDNVGIVSLDLFLDATPVPLDEQGRAVIPVPAEGSFFNFHTLMATARDAAGNVGTSSITVNFRNQFTTEGSTNAPTLAITSPAENGIVTGPTDIIGTVDDDNLSGYRLYVRRGDQDESQFVEIAAGTAPVVNGVLGRFDPTLLENDGYVLRLEADDTTGGRAFIDHTFGVSGELKLGNFRLSFTDLSIPVSGIPITVSRTYDTLRADREGDFGFGWRMEFRNADLRTSLPKTGLEEYGIHAAFRPGTRVYITLPGGRREGFTFNPDIRAIFDLVVATPRFTPDPGVTNRLTVRPATLIVNEFNELHSGGGQPYNPAAEEFGGGYTLTTKEGIVYRLHGTTGNLLHVTDRNDNLVTFDDAGVHSSTGKEITFQRDARNRITDIIDPMGHLIQYQYDARGDLVAVTDREDNTTRFEYRTNRPHYLDKVIDPLGRTGARTEYDATGRLVRTFDAKGNSIDLTHDLDNNLEIVRDQLGNPTTYEYDARGNIVTEINALGGITRRTYDANNNMLTMIDPVGHTTRYTYNATRDVLTQTDPLGNVSRFTYNAFGDPVTQTDPLGHTSAHAYDHNGNRLSSTNALGHVTTFRYDARGNNTSLTDAQGNVTRFDYDAAGNLITETNALAHVTTFTYDANGNQRTATSTLTTPAGVRTLVTTTTYDENDRPIFLTDAEGGVTRTEYNALGQVTASIDALTRRTEYIFDERGLQVETIYPDNTPADHSDNPHTRGDYNERGDQTRTIDERGRRTEYRYDALGRLTETIYPDSTPIDLADNPRTSVEYDAAGRTVAQIDERGNRTEYEYDDDGQPTKTRDALLHITTQTYDAAGRYIATTDPHGHTTQFVYDALGRSVRTAFLNGTATSTTYGVLGHVIAKTDQDGRTTRYEYDNLGRLVAVIDALGQVTEYAYNELGNLVTQTDALGRITRYEYDGLGRRIATVLPMGQRSITTYDPVGNVESITDFNGDTITYEYDSRDRLSAKRFPDGTSVVISYTAVGLRETVQDARGITRYVYDERDRLLSRTDPDGQGISYTYDSAGNRTSVTTLAGTTAYTFDALNRMETVTAPDGGLTQYTYDAASNLIRTDNANGSFETREYDKLDRVLFIQTIGPTGVLASFRYTLGRTGRREAVVEHDGRRVEYAYDELDRLVKEAIHVPASGNRTIEYTYDVVGNRPMRNDSAEGVTIYTYDANDRLRAETLNGETTVYAYDDNGNQVSRYTSPTDHATYRWDFENHLIGGDVTDASSTKHANYRYDVDGGRVANIVDDTETRLLIDAACCVAQVLAEYTPTGAINVSYVFGHRLIVQHRGGNLWFYHVDVLGSTRLLTDAGGSPINHYIYDAFGGVVYQDLDLGNVHLFTSERRDPSVGWDYLRARNYDPANGRFTSKDPFTGLTFDPQSLHSYLYAHANPVNNIDPSGNLTLSETLTVFAIEAVVSAAISVFVDVAIYGERNVETVITNAVISGVVGGLFGVGTAQVVESIGARLAAKAAQKAAAEATSQTASKAASQTARGALARMNGDLVYVIQSWQQGGRAFFGALCDLSATVLGRESLDYVLTVGVHAIGHFEPNTPQRLFWYSIIDNVGGGRPYGNLARKGVNCP